ARLVRDAQIGTLWEGTSNINALDVVQRAVGKAGGHKTLTAALKAKYEPSGSLPGQYKGLLGATLDRVERFAEAVASDPKHEKRSRVAAGALYHAATAALMAWEGATLGAQGGDARRLLLSRLVIEHRLAPQDPLSLNEPPWEQEAMDLLLQDKPVPLAKATALLS
ncbi:MAG: DNA alkylation response protein, partial [Reyranellales bacterium]